MGLWTQLFGKEARIQLVLAHGRCTLKCFYDGETAPFSQILEKWPQAAPLQSYFSQPDASEAPLDTERLVQARTALQALQGQVQKRKLTLEIEEKLANAAPVPGPPEDFRIGYVRQGEGLRQVLEEQTDILSDSWILRGGALWRCPGLAAQEQFWLCQAEIAPEYLLVFLRDALPAFQRAGIRAESELTYTPLPAVQVQILECTRERVRLLPVWAVSPDAMQDLPALSGYGLAGGELRPALSLAALRQVFPDYRRERTLEGAEIGAFLDTAYPAFQNFMIGQVSAFEQLHHWAATPFSWALQVTPEEGKAGVVPVARPVARIGDVRASPAEVAAAQAQPYACFASGWARQKDLRGLKLNDAGTMIGRFPVRALPLTARQLLCRGDERLQGPWEAMELLGPAWCVQGEKHLCAARHLAFLTGWGLRGGLTGGYEAFAAYGLPFLLQYAARGAKQVLVVGGQEDIQALEGLHFPALQFATYRTIRRGAKISAAAWDLAVLLEPDQAPAGESGRVLAAARLNARQTLYFFLHAPEAAASRQDLKAAELLQCEAAPELLPLLVRDCREAAPLPQAYHFQPTWDGSAALLSGWKEKEAAFVPAPDTKQPQPPAVPEKKRQPAPPLAQEYAVEITLPGPAPKSTPIPPRPARRPQPAETPPPAPLPANPAQQEAPEAKGKITLNLRELSQLRRDSNEVRQALLDTGNAPPDDGAKEIPPGDLTPVQPPGREAAAPGWTYDPEGLDEGWRAFFASADLEALAALQEGGGALAQLARARRVPPDVVLDTLNGLAQDTIGDLVADDQGILDDYAGQIRNHLRKE